MPHAAVNGIDIYHETVGDPGDPTLLLINGLGAQLLHWDLELCEAFAARGFHVVRYDNRDVGLSTHLEGDVDVLSLMGGQQVAVPYLLRDMAADAVGLLDHLGVERAHVLGVSMGGMIAQTVAIEHPHRVQSLTSIMSTTGEPHVGAPTGEALEVLLAPPAQTVEESADETVRHAHVWGSPGLFDEDRLRRQARAAWERNRDPAGAARQLAAILASGSRADALVALDVPTLVVHGTEDKLVQPSGGERTAELVPDAKLLIVDGMGHDLPVPLWPRLVDAVTAHATEHTGA